MRSGRIILALAFLTLMAGSAMGQQIRIMGNRAYVPNAMAANMQGVQTVPTQSGMVTIDFSQQLSSTGIEMVYPVVGAGTAASPGFGGAAPAAPATPSIEVDVDVMEAAGTLTDPYTFIYLSQEYVFNLLVLASTVGVGGATFDINSVPTTVVPDTTANAAGGYAYDEYYGADTAAAPPATQQTGGSPTADVDHTGWLNAVSVSDNSDLGKLLELVEDATDWRRIGRYELLTSEKIEIDKSIAEVYSAAFSGIGPQATNPYNSGYYSGSSYWTDDSSEGGYYGGTPVTPVPAQQTTPPVDPIAMGEWYYYYQQLIGWERYVADETLLLEEGENTNKYDLDTALGGQDLYLVPSPDGSPQLIHFDLEETEMTPYLSAVRPSALKTAIGQMEREMRDWAEQRAEEDSERSRSFVERLDERQDRRFRYRDWLNDQATEIRKMAEDYRKRLAGEHIEIEGMEILLTREPLDNVPFRARNIVTERLTPYDLLDAEGRIIRPRDEAAAEPLM